jgi:hypothetical protein
LGLTKLVISIRGRPASISAPMNAILSAVGTWRASFCSPSRGPTSYTVTRAGSFMGPTASPYPAAA